MSARNVECDCAIFHSVIKEKVIAIKLKEQSATMVLNCPYILTLWNDLLIVKEPFFQGH